ncbi:MAG: hypothetical protein KAS81_04935, partial [Anaerolineales bacterium]|nr:hypothetical protein [Anaerolineales bacterium]
MSTRNGLRDPPLPAFHVHQRNCRGDGASLVFLHPLVVSLAVLIPAVRVRWSVRQAQRVSVVPRADRTVWDMTSRLLDVDHHFPLFP